MTQVQPLHTHAIGMHTLQKLAAEFLLRCTWSIGGRSQLLGSWLLGGGAVVLCYKGQSWSGWDRQDQGWCCVAEVPGLTLPWVMVMPAVRLGRAVLCCCAVLPASPTAALHIVHLRNQCMQNPQRGLCVTTW